MLSIIDILFKTSSTDIHILKLEIWWCENIFGAFSILKTDLHNSSPILGISFLWTRVGKYIVLCSVNVLLIPAIPNIPHTRSLELCIRLTKISVNYLVTVHNIDIKVQPSSAWVEKHSAWRCSMLYTSLCFQAFRRSGANISCFSSFSALPLSLWNQYWYWLLWA